MPIQFQTELVDAEHDLVPIKREYEKAPLDHAFDIGQVDLNYVFGRMRVIVPGTAVTSDGETQAHVPVCDYDSRSTFLRIREMFRRTYEHAMDAQAELESNEEMGGDKLTDSDGMALTSVKANDLSETFVRAIALTALGGSLEDIELVNKMAVESSLTAAWKDLLPDGTPNYNFNAKALAGDFGGNSKLLKNFLLGEALGYVAGDGNNNNREHCDSVGPVERQLEVDSIAFQEGKSAESTFAQLEFVGVVTLTKGVPRAYSVGDQVLVWDTDKWVAKYVLAKHPGDGDEVSRDVEKGDTELYVNAVADGTSPPASGDRILIAGSPLVTQVDDQSPSTYQDGWVKQLMRRVFRLTQSLPERAERFQRRRFAEEGDPDPLLSDGRDESLFITTRMQAVLHQPAGDVVDVVDGQQVKIGDGWEMQSGLWRKVPKGCKVYLLGESAHFATVAQDAEYGATAIVLALVVDPDDPNPPTPPPAGGTIQIETVSNVKWDSGNSMLQIEIAGLPPSGDAEFDDARKQHEDAKKMRDEVSGGDILVVRGSGTYESEDEAQRRGFDGIYKVKDLTSYADHKLPFASNTSNLLNIPCTYESGDDAPATGDGHEDVSIYKRTGKPDETDPRGMRDLTFVMQNGTLTQDEDKCPWGRPGDAIRLKPRFHNKDVITLAMQLTVKRRNTDLAALNPDDRPTRRFGLRIQHLQDANTQDHDQVTDGHMDSIMAGSLDPTVQKQLVTQPERTMAEVAYGITVQEFIATGKYTVGGIGTDMWNAEKMWLSTFRNNYGDDADRTTEQQQAAQVSTQAGLQLTNTDVSDRDLLNDGGDNGIGLKHLFQARKDMVTDRDADYKAFVATTGEDSFLQVLSSEYAQGDFDREFLAADSDESFRGAAIAILDGRVTTFENGSKLGERGHLLADEEMYHGLAELHAGLQDMTTPGHTKPKAPYSAYDLLDVLSTALRTVRLQTDLGHAAVIGTLAQAIELNALGGKTEAENFKNRGQRDLERAEALAHALIDYNRYSAALDDIFSATTVDPPDPAALAKIRNTAFGGALNDTDENANPGSILRVDKLAIETAVSTSGAQARILEDGTIQFRGSGYNKGDIVPGLGNKFYEVTKVMGELAGYEDIHGDDDVPENDVTKVPGLNAREELLGAKLRDLGVRSLFLLLKKLDDSVEQTDVKVESGALVLKEGLYAQVAENANTNPATNYTSDSFRRDDDLVNLKANLPTDDDSGLVSNDPAIVPNFKDELDKIEKALDNYHAKLSADKLADLKVLL
ncbi:MAG: hypothetical protein VYE77_00945, partial [Planctomycetota bacterium]|nr:hypothetical protein [Planctomycetota bacterium]